MTWPPRSGDAVEVTIGQADAEDLCAEPYSSVADARHIASVLRRAGWHVPQEPPARGPGGVWVLATVLHPETHESAGELRYVEPPEPRSDPGS